jgi:hypothetical protein
MLQKRLFQGNRPVITGSGTKRDDARVIVVNDVRWLVYEHLAPLDRRSWPSLVFESDDTIRRVRRAPADWREWSDEALFELSWTT